MARLAAQSNATQSEAGKFRFGLRELFCVTTAIGAVFACWPVFIGATSETSIYGLPVRFLDAPIGVMGTLMLLSLILMPAGTLLMLVLISDDWQRSRPVPISGKLFFVLCLAGAFIAVGGWETGWHRYATGFVTYSMLILMITMWVENDMRCQRTQSLTCAVATAVAFAYWAGSVMIVFRFAS